LDGAVNVRDLGGLPASNGTVRSGRLIRSDNLQGLTPADVRKLVDDRRLRSVVDLRTSVEVESEGPGPLRAEPLVRIEHLSLFPEAGENTDVVAAEGGDEAIGGVGAVVTGVLNADVLPWVARRAADGKRNAVQTYLRYLAERPDSVVAALRLIAATDGATIVHCAAGKDRTGVVIAVALAEVGVEREAIVADFALTAQRLDLILARLAASPTYARDLEGSRPEQHEPRAETMSGLLGEVDARYGGLPAWLRRQGWTDADAAALRKALIE
jgi:protein tyrosine/serine phosphatase